MTGVDLSQAALRRAEELAQTAGVQVRLVRSDMTELEVNHAHDALICMGNSIGYFDPSLTRKLLGKLAGALRAGGRLILDTSICAESVLPLAAERTFCLPGCTYEQQITYDAEQSVIDTLALLTIDGQRHELHYRHFVMTSGELVRSLSSAGFDIRGMYGDTQDGTFRPGSPRLLLVAERK